MLNVDTSEVTWFLKQTQFKLLQLCLKSNERKTKLTKRKQHTVHLLLKCS